MPKQVINVDDDTLSLAFEEAFRARIDDPASDMTISEFGCVVQRENLGDMVLAVTIYGMAGDTTRAEFHDPKTGKTIRGGKSIIVKAGGKSYRFNISGSVDLNTNDYVIYYKQAVEA